MKCGLGIRPSAPFIHAHFISSLKFSHHLFNPWLILIKSWSIFINLCVLVVGSTIVPLLSPWVLLSSVFFFFFFVLYGFTIYIIHTDCPLSSLWVPLSSKFFFLCIERIRIDNPYNPYRLIRKVFYLINFIFKILC